MTLIPYEQSSESGTTDDDDGSIGDHSQALACKAQFSGYNRSQLVATQPGLQRLYQVQAQLQADLLACDARWSLFVAAITSPRYETLVRPYPKEFLSNEQRLQVDQIFEILADMPRLELILQQLRQCQYERCPGRVMRLLHAILVKHGDRVALSTLRPCEYQELYDHLGLPPPNQTPTHILEVTPSLKCAHTKAYARLREQFPVKLGYYGGPLEQFYAMLTAGCLPADKPLLLHTDANAALKQCPRGAAWGGSRCGSVLRCLALVEFVFVPELVSAVNDNRQVLINDASCMQISYLLLYGQSCLEYEASQPCQQLLSWVDANKYAISLGVYLMIVSFTSNCGRGYLRCFASTSLNLFKRGLLKF